MSSSEGENEEVQNYDLDEMLRQGDRFIGNRDQMNMAAAQYNMSNQHSRRATKHDYSLALTKCLFGEEMTQVVENEKILALQTKAPAPCIQYHESLRVRYATPARKKKKRVINEKEYRTLSAPGLRDFFQSNPIDWSGTNTIAVALDSTLYYWNADVNNRTRLSIENDNVPITCVSWAPENTSVLGVATDDGLIHLWDVERHLQIRVFREHCGRVSCLSWRGGLLSSGSCDTSIINWDVRIRHAHVSSFHGHSGEVTGLVYSADGSQLVSGGTDCLVNLWETTTQRQILLGVDVAHMASVKALAWCPWQSTLLATGGGVDDGMIKLWNTQTGVMLDCVETGYQVIALRWFTPRRELISAHGYGNPYIIIWSYPTMSRVAKFTSHEARIIGISLSPDNQILVSASGDETLKFWRLLEPSTDVSEPGGTIVSHTRSIR